MPAPPAGEPVAITLKHEPAAPAATPAPPPPARADDTCYVRNSSFLSRDIEARASRADPQPARTALTRALPGVPGAVPGAPGVVPGASGVAGVARQSSTSSTSSRDRPPSPPRRADPPAVKSPPIKSPPPVTSPLVKSPPVRGPVPQPASVTSPPARRATPPRADVTSPPAPEHNKPAPLVIKNEDTSNAPRTTWRESPVAKEGPVKVEKLSLASTEIDRPVESGEGAKVEDDKVENEADKDNNKTAKSEESNGVGDKIKKFEKAAEDASGTMGRMSRPGSVRGRPRTERLGSDNSREDLPPPATPFKDNVHFELSAAPAERAPTVLERQQSLTRSAANAARWQRGEPDGEKARPEPQKIIKPEFKPMPSPVDVTIRSPSLGAKIADQFPSHGTAFRNVASPDPARSRDPHKVNDDVNTQNNFKTCKFKTKDKYSVSKGSSYFTRGSEEIWLVKKKDIEEIEERVLDSFRRAGGNVCMRSESMRPSSDSGQGASFTHATMGRNKRQMYARSESLDPQWAGARAHTLKRQSSVACTCGHDKKTRSKSANADTTPRPRSRSHGDDNNQAHVLDKYETLV